MSIDGDALKIIPLIYDAAENASLWPEVLNQISATLNAVGKVFTIEDLRRDKSRITICLDIDPDFQRLYNAHYESVNLHLQRARPLLAPGRVIATHQICSERETLASEYYQEFLRPQEESWFHVVGGCVEKERSLLSVINFMRGRQTGPFSDTEIKFLETVMPHLQRAVRLHHAFALHRDIAAWSDVLSVGVLLVDARRHIQFANRPALEIIRADDGIRVDKQGCLTSTNKQLSDFIAAACSTVAGVGMSPGAVCLVPRPSGLRAYGVFVSPVRHSNPFSAQPFPGALIMVSDPETSRISLETLTTMYGLTRAEAQVARLLADGKDTRARSARPFESARQPLGRTCGVSERSLVRSVKPKWFRRF